ncbi:MAG: hypothetical protein BMS9Abin13_499 [Patescibacteria group bacterium]|nr:MAG: hypothetical protein BMS9Abin13_499 [Patescibacteria group bacterium]
MNTYLRLLAVMVAAVSFFATPENASAYPGAGYSNSGNSQGQLSSYVNTYPPGNMFGGHIVPNKLTSDSGRVLRLISSKVTGCLSKKDIPLDGKQFKGKVPEKLLKRAVAWAPKETDYLVVKIVNGVKSSSFSLFGIVSVTKGPRSRYDGNMGGTTATGRPIAYIQISACRYGGPMIPSKTGKNTDQGSKKN